MKWVSLSSPRYQATEQEEMYLSCARVGLDWTLRTTFSGKELESIGTLRVSREVVQSPSLETF